jgi:hypothetical protein
LEKRKFIAELSAELVACQERINQTLLRQKSDWYTQPIHPKGWTPLEVLNHIQLMNEYYIDWIIGCLKKAGPGSDTIRLSFIEKEVSNILSGKNKFLGKVKLPSPKAFKPRRSNDSWDIGATLEEFNDQLELIVSLLNQSEKFDLSKTVIPLPFFKLLQISPAGAFKIMVSHLKRHFKQIPFDQLS